MTFARHLAAVLLTVAVVVALGLAWAHSSGASGLAGPGPVHPGPLARAHHHAPIALSRPSGPGLRLSNSGDLMRTAVIEALIMAVVVAVSALRRQRRRARRAAALPAASCG